MKKLIKMVSATVTALLCAVFVAFPSEASLFCPGETEDSLCDCYMWYDSENHQYWCTEHDQAATELEAHYSEDGDEVCDFCGYDPNYVPPSDDDPEDWTEMEYIIINEAGPMAIEMCIECGYDPFEFVASEDGTVTTVSFSEPAREMLIMICMEYGFDDSYITDELLTLGAFEFSLESYEYEYTGSSIAPRFSIDNNFLEQYEFYFELGEPSFVNVPEEGYGVVAVGVYVQGFEEPACTLVQEFSIISDGETPDDPTPNPPLTEAGWKEDSVGVWYQYEDGSYAVGWAQIEGYWYYFDASGYMERGWTRVGNKWYLFDEESGIMYEDGRYLVDDLWYAFDKSGAMVTGWFSEVWVYEEYDNYEEVVWFYALPSGQLATRWQQIAGKWYYFAEEDGIMYWGGPVPIDGAKYIFDESGAMVTGWYSREEFYYDPETGEMSPAGITWYYCESSGALACGWKTINGVTYYFDDEWGDMYSDGIYYIDGKDYRFDASGALVVLSGWYEEKYTWEDEDGVIHNGSDWYYYLADGSYAIGWKKINGTWYYFHPEYGFMYSDCRENIGGEWYYFQKSGAMATGWIKEVWDEESGYYDWYYANPDGSLKTGWALIGGKWYYFDEYWAYMYSDGVRYIEAEDKDYVFDKSGAMVTGWYKQEWSWEEDDGTVQSYVDWYYANPDGTLYDGWLKSSGKWYYIDDGWMVYFDVVEDDGNFYFIQEDGILCTTPGWLGVQGLNTAWLYVKNTSGELQTGWKTINGVDYYFVEEYYDYEDEVTGEWHSFWPGEMLYSCSIVMDGCEYVFDEEGACVEVKELPN